MRNFTRRGPNPDAHTKTMTRSGAIRTERLDAYTHHSLHHHWPTELLLSAGSLLARPWWSVDLAVRFRDFDLHVSADGQEWRTVQAVRGDRIWGGIDGDPFLFRPDAPLTARHARVIPAASGTLHLDQVETYGEPHHQETRPCAAPSSR